MFLKVTIGDTKVTLATIYAPNNNQDPFICATIKKLMKFTEG